MHLLSEEKKEEKKTISILLLFLKETTGLSVVHARLQNKVIFISEWMS
jgi:hypothetical protein